MGPGTGRRDVSRRTLLLGAGGVALAAVAGAFAGVETGVLPGRPNVDRALGLGEVDVPVPSGDVGPVSYRSFRSVRRGMDVTWGLGLPPGGREGLPVVLVLHGRGADAHSGFTALHLQSFLADHVRRGGRPLALVSVDGDDRYWHPRANGDDPLGMITDELLPRVAQQGLRVDRIGLTGWSMGGYASLMMARQSERGRLGGLVVAAAAASSPALFASFASSSPGAFDDAADWRRWGDLAAQPGVASTPLRVCCGTSDPFAEQTRVYRRHCARPPEGGLTAGRHEDGYWRSLLPGHLDFLGRHLAGK
jgi:S-formylglutathione hydrolase FrmB